MQQYHGLIARIAFIGNIFFGVCILLQRSASGYEAAMVSLVAILGLGIGMLLANPLSNILNGLHLFRKRSLPVAVPLWLALVNLLFLLLQIFYIIHSRS